MLLDRLAHLVPSRLAGALAKPGGPWSSRLARLGARLAMSPAERFASLRRFQTPAARQYLYSDRLLQEVDAVADAYLVDAYARAEGEELTRMQCTDVLTYLPEELLVKVDRMAMAHSLEARSPLLDHELIDFSLRIPAEMKISWRRGKLVFCEAMRHHFPPGFLDRPKMGFSVPVAHWLRTDLHDECRKRLTSGILARTGWFNTAALTRLLDEHAAGVQDWNIQLWNLLVLAVWAELFID
jgi:asparagine synthase (glutamine-hydrolysing)